MVEGPWRLAPLLSRMAFGDQRLDPEKDLSELPDGAEARRGLGSRANASPPLPEEGKKKPADRKPGRSSKHTSCGGSVSVFFFFFGRVITPFFFWVVSKGGPKDTDHFFESFRS